MTRIFRALCAGAVVVSTVAITPLSASASGTTEYVIVERDGSVDVRTLTQAQAAKAAIDPAVRIVQPNTVGLYIESVIIKLKSLGICQG